MESSDDGRYDILEIDLSLNDPGEVEDTRLVDLAVEEAQQDRDAHLADKVAQVSRDIHESGLATFVCVLGVSLPAHVGHLARNLFRRNFGQDLRRMLRAPESILDEDDKRFVLALGARDESEARGRLELLSRQAGVRLNSDGESAELRGGLARVQDHNGLHALHSAALALEMSAFQETGHVEFIDI